MKFNKSALTITKAYAQKLVACVSTGLSEYHRLVGDVAQVIQDEQSRHQADWLRGATVVLDEQGANAFSKESQS